MPDDPTKPPIRRLDQLLGTPKLSTGGTLHLPSDPRLSTPTTLGDLMRIAGGSDSKIGLVGDVLVGDLGIRSLVNGSAPLLIQLPQVGNLRSASADGIPKVQLGYFSATGKDVSWNTETVGQLPFSIPTQEFGDLNSIPSILVGALGGGASIRSQFEGIEAVTDLLSAVLETKDVLEMAREAGTSEGSRIGEVTAKGHLTLIVSIDGAWVPGGVKQPLAGLRASALGLLVVGVELYGPAFMALDAWVTEKAVLQFREPLWNWINKAWLMQDVPNIVPLIPDIKPTDEPWKSLIMNSPRPLGVPTLTVQIGFRIDLPDELLKGLPASTALEPWWSPWRISTGTTYSSSSPTETFTQPTGSLGIRLDGSDPFAASIEGVGLRAAFNDDEEQFQRNLFLLGMWSKWMTMDWNNPDFLRAPNRASVSTTGPSNFVWDSGISSSEDVMARQQRLEKLERLLKERRDKRRKLWMDSIGSQKWEVYFWNYGGTPDI